MDGSTGWASSLSLVVGSVEMTLDQYQVSEQLLYKKPSLYQKPWDHLWITTYSGHGQSFLVIRFSIHSNSTHKQKPSLTINGERKASSCFSLPHHPPLRQHRTCLCALPLESRHCEEEAEFCRTDQTFATEITFICGLFSIHF